MKKIFVVGCPRSGTTLIHKLLGIREDTYTCKETHYFQKIRRNGKRKVFDYLYLSNKNVLSAYDFIQSHNYLLGKYDPSEVYTIKAATLFFDHLMISEAQAREKTAWVEKTPAHLFYIKLIKKQIKSALFVHVLRDGRDVVASLVDAAKRNPQSLAWKENIKLKTAINTYNRCLEVSLKYYGSKDHIFIKYEDLLDKTEQSVEFLYRKIGFEDSFFSLNFDNIHEKVVRNDEIWKQGPSNEIKDTRLIKFNQIFNDYEKQEIINSIALPNYEI